MNVAVKILKILAAMSDHRPGKRRHGFRGDLDGAGDEELIVGSHWNGETLLRKATAGKRPILLRKASAEQASTPRPKHSR